MARREYQSGQPTTLQNPLNIGGTTFTISLTDVTLLAGWPDGAEGYNFWVTVDAGTPQEERILCASRSGSVVTVAASGRGADGTTQSNHAAGAEVWPSWSATDADEANAHINATTNVHGYTATNTEINILDGATLSTAELNILDGATLSTAELNVLDGITASTTELNYTDGVTSAIQTQLNTNTPVGSIVMWAKNEIPTGWLECNGQSTASYPALAGVVGATVPDMQGLVPVGFKTSDDAFGTLKGTGGSKTSTAAHTHGLASHTHTINHDHAAFTSGNDSPDHSHTAVFYDTASNQGDSNGGQFDTGSDQPTAERYIPTTGASVPHQHSIDVPSFTGSSGGPSDNTSGASSAAATNGNLQPYFTLKFIIKT